MQAQQKVERARETTLQHIFQIPMKSKEGKLGKSVRAATDRQLVQL